MTRREHHADPGDHSVELAVGEWQRLGIGFSPLEPHTF
jgi:hypothetical protein